VVRDEASMPSQERVGLHEEDRPAVTVEHTSEPGEERPVVVFEARSRDLTLQDRELVAQHENLGVLGPVPVTPQHQQVDNESDKTVEAGHT
jgi:hypothetical protein